MKNLIKEFENLYNASFISLNNYTNKFGEISNQTINVNINVIKTKQKDLITLKKVTEADLILINEKYKINDINIVKLAYNEILSSETKNLKKEISNHTNQSKGQLNAYTKITSGVKLHNETQNLLIYGFAVSKTIINEGIYPNVNSRAKTIAKNAIKEHLNLKMNKYRNFLIKKTDSVKISGTTQIIK